jgi:hypothetical protein
VAAWKMREQILHCLDAKTPQGQQTRAGDPAEFFKRLRNRNGFER